MINLDKRFQSNLSSMVKIRKLTNEDFLRIDKAGTEFHSFVHKKINQLFKINPIFGLFWKLFFAPRWIIFSYRQPKIIIKNTNYKIHRFLVKFPNGPFCIRARVPFVYYSLSRIVYLDRARISKHGEKYRKLRGEINKAERNGFNCEIFQNSEAIKVLDEMHQKSGFRNWRDVTRIQDNFDSVNLVVGACMNQKLDIVAVSAVWLSGTYSFNFYYYATEKKYVRWLLTERLIEDMFCRDVLVFHTDNLMDLSVGSYAFQKNLGYETVRLKFR
jgi:hypothetical protein